MKRFFKITLAFVRCHFHLLTNGMWRGECMLTKETFPRKRLFYIGTVKNFGRAGLEFPKVFYHETIPFL